MLNDARFLIKKLQNAVGQLSYFPQTIKLVWTTTWGWTLSWLVLLTVLGLTPAGLVYLSRLLVDNLVAAIEADAEWTTITPVLYVVLGILVLMLVTEFLQSISDWIREAQAELIKDKLHTLIHEKSIAIDIAFYESPDYYDQLHRAREDAGARSLTLIESTGSLLKSGITLVAMATLLLPYSFWVPLALLIKHAAGFFCGYSS